MRKIIRDFLQLESASSLVLFAATVAALLWANSPAAYLYDNFTNSFQFIVNEGLMTFFFLLVGLELKRGSIEGHFSRASDVMLPLVAAFGGMLVPALIYLLCNYHHPVAVKGWAIPVATDIAFAVGVLSLFGKRIPRQLKLLLLSIAIFDDIGAIIIIALVYAQHLSIAYLLYSFLVMTALLIMNACNIRSLIVYLLGGTLLWAMFLKAGIHPTLAGVVTAFLIPELPKREVTSIHYLEAKLHPWVAFMIMPIFALTNAGLSFSHVTSALMMDTVVIGIVLGLFLGKQTGVLGVIWLSMKTRQWAKMPQHSTWLDIYGIALLCGIGFTMSLFLGTLSFQGQSHYIDAVKLGVIIGSILSGIAGASVLALSIKRKSFLKN